MLVLLVVMSVLLVPISVLLAAMSASLALPVRSVISNLPTVYRLQSAPKPSGAGAITALLICTPVIALTTILSILSLILIIS